MKTKTPNRRYRESSWRHAVVPATIWGAVIVVAALGGLVDTFSIDTAPQQLADKRGPTTTPASEAAKAAAAR
jgi:hypothetical protein